MLPECPADSQRGSQAIPVRPAAKPTLRCSQAPPTLVVLDYGAPFMVFCPRKPPPLPQGDTGPHRLLLCDTRTSSGCWVFRVVPNIPFRSPPHGFSEARSQQPPPRGQDPHGDSLPGLSSCLLVWSGRDPKLANRLSPQWPEEWPCPAPKAMPG